MPVSFITVGLKNAIPYPIQFHAADFINTIRDMSLTVVSCYFYLNLHLNVYFPLLKLYITIY